MSDSIETYTYRGGEKIELTKSTDQFVVEAPADLLVEQGFSKLEQVSPTSNRVTVVADVLEIAMVAGRSLGPAHHAYAISSTRQEFLISDRVFVSFSGDVRPAQIDALMERYALLLVKMYLDRVYLFRLSDRTGMNPLKLVRKLTENEEIVRAADHDLNYRVQKCGSQAPSKPSYLDRQVHLNRESLILEAGLPGSGKNSIPLRQLKDHGESEIVIGIPDGRSQHQALYDSPDKLAGWAYWDSYPGIAMPRLVTNQNMAADPSKLELSANYHIAESVGTHAATTPALHLTGERFLPVRFESQENFYFTSDSQLYDTLYYLGDKVDVLVNPWSSILLTLFAPIVVRLCGNLAIYGGRSGKGLFFVRLFANQDRAIRSIRRRPYLARAVRGNDMEKRLFSDKSMSRGHSYRN